MQIVLTEQNASLMQMKKKQKYYWIQLTVVGIVIATNKVPLRISRRVVYTTKQF